MSNMHRIIWFDQQIRAGKYPNRKTLSEKFEISIRQAQRDIDYFKDFLGAPLIYDAKRRGYNYDNETFVIPSAYIDNEQKKLLSFLAYRYDNYTQTPKVIETAKLFKKLSGAQEFKDDIPVFDLEKSIDSIYYSIMNSIKNKTKIKIVYNDPHKGEIYLNIHPYKLFHRYRTDNTACFCEEYDEIIVLRIDRIKTLKTLKEKFEVSSEFRQSNYSSFVEKEPYTAKIKFKVKPDFLERKGLYVKEIEDLIYEIEFFNIDEFISSLLRYDCWDKILFPKWLKKKLRERCCKIMNKLDI